MTRKLEEGKKYTIVLAGRVCKIEHENGCIHVYQNETNWITWLVDKETRKGIHIICYLISPTPIAQFWPWTLIREVSED